MVEESPHWSHNQELAYLPSGLHWGYPFKEGFPEDSQGTFEIITAWGEHIKGVSLLTISDSYLWDATRRQSKGGSDRLHDNGLLLEQEYVAGWRRLS